MYLVYKKLKFSATVCTKHVAKTQNALVKVLVMCEYVLEPAKTILNDEGQSLAIFHSLVYKLENVFHSMLNVMLH